MTPEQIKAFERDTAVVRKVFNDWMALPPIEKAIRKAGGLRALARALGITHQAIMQWDKMPAHRILQIEAATGVPRELLRPDFYR